MRQGPVALGMCHQLRLWPPPRNRATAGSSRTRFRRGLRVSSPTHRMTLRGECETLRLAVQIAEPPCIKECSVAATRREISEPGNRGGLVT